MLGSDRFQKLHSELTVALHCWPPIAEGACLKARGYQEPSELCCYKVKPSASCPAASLTWPARGILQLHMLHDEDGHALALSTPYLDVILQHAGEVILKLRATEVGENLLPVRRVLHAAPD